MNKVKGSRSGTRDGNHIRLPSSYMLIIGHFNVDGENLMNTQRTYYANKIVIVIKRPGMNASFNPCVVSILDNANRLKGLNSNNQKHICRTQLR